MTNAAEDGFLEALERSRKEFRLPALMRVRTEQFARDVLAFLFPHFETVDSQKIPFANRWTELVSCLRDLVLPLAPETDCEKLGEHLGSKLPDVRNALLLDANSILANDPAAESLDEVIVAYPGFYAIALHRIAHCFYECGVQVFPRLLSEFAHRQTGIDIHPGATIGKEFCIDHGTGVVIGETAVIGDRVRIFQGVTLGALTVSKQQTAQKRHPTIEDDVVIYANATILGGETVVGSKSVIGGNVWLTRSVPPESVVTETSHLKKPGAPAETLLEFQI